MENAACGPSKVRYDISKSKRTRKPALNVQESKGYDDPEEEKDDKISLKELMIDATKDFESELNHESSGNIIVGKEIKNEIKSNSLGQHFTEEEKKQQRQQQQLQLVRKNKGGAAKLKGMVSHCVKVLTHLIAVNQPDRRLRSGKKNHFLRLHMKH